MKGTIKRTSKMLSPQAVTGCLDVLCKAYAQVAPVDANLAKEITQAIETIMEACNTPEKLEENVELTSKNDSEQFKQLNAEVIEDIFTGEILYKGLK